MSKMDFDVFNLSIDDVVKDDKPQGNSNLYSPSYDKASDGVYKSKIRFIPNINNPREPIMRKYVYYLKDHSTDSGFYVDSPSTIGERCPIQDTFFKLRNSKNAAEKEMSDELKRKEFFYAAVQIIKDKQAPDLEGQIKIFRFGYKIKQKIDEQLRPVVDDAEPNNPFDLFDGKVFNLVIVKKDGYANYDSSVFASKGSAISIDGNEMSDDDDDKETIVEYLKENTPDFNEFKFKEWDDETRKKVNKILKQCGSVGSDISTITSDDDDEDEVPVKKTSKKRVVEEDDDEDEVPVKKSKKKVVEDDEDDDEDDEPKKPAKKSKVVEDDDDEDEVPVKKSKKKVEDEDEDDDFDEFLKDIDDL